MLLSIIVPLYKAEMYIKRCIMSLINQDLSPKDYEIIIVDDGSPDDSAEIAESLQKTYQNIIVVHKKNGGAASARNFGMNIAKGKYVMFVDSDDYINPNVLGELIATCLQYDLDFLGYGFTDVRDGFSISRPTKYPHPGIIMSVDEYISNYSVYISACGHLAKREIYENNKLRFYEGIILEDYEFMFRLYGLINRMMFTNTIVYNYDIKDSNTVTTIRTESQNRRSIESWIKIIESLTQCRDDNLIRETNIDATNLLLSNYKYIALTNLLLKKVPLRDKFDYLKSLKKARAFNLGKSNLDKTRKLRSSVYKIPGAFELLLILTYPLSK